MAYLLLFILCALLMSVDLWRPHAAQLFRRLVLRQPTAAELAQEARERGWEALEAEQAAACLDALTLADVEYLRALGWEPSAEVERRVTRAHLERRKAEAEERVRKARAEKDARRRAAGKLTQSELAALADARIQKGDYYRVGGIVTGGTIHAGPLALGPGGLTMQEEAARRSMDHYLGLRGWTRDDIYVAEHAEPVRHVYRRI